MPDYRYLSRLALPVLSAAYIFAACGSSGGTTDASGSHGGASAGGGAPAGGTATGGAAAESGGQAGNAGGVPTAGGTLSAGSGGSAGTGGAGTGAAGGSAGSSNAGASGAETVGTGDIAKPALGPAPSDAGKVGGAAFTLVKNWDFGTDGTITDSATLIAEFLFHDQFNTIANGTNYGSVIVAENAATAISAGNLGLPNDMQPVEDAAHPTREWTASSLKANVRPLSPAQTTCTVSAHDTGAGSLMAKWKLGNGGTLLGKDILWETRVRMPTPLAAYWFALWTSGNQWNKGAEMDVLESFGTPNIYPPAGAFHVNSVGGQDTIDYGSWPNGLDAAGVPKTGRDLSAYHVWTWLYAKDDSYKVYFDGVVAQTGTIHWTLGGTAGGTPIDMDFLFDFSWGHTQIADVNISLPAASFPLVYEIDYSRVYLR